MSSRPVTGQDGPEIVMAEVETIILRLYRRDNSKTFTSAFGRQIRGVIVANMITFKDALLNSSACTYFRPMLNGNLADFGRRVIDMEQEHVVAFELWLRLFHGTVNNESYRIPIVDIWHAVMIQRMYGFDFGSLSSWFTEWLWRAGGKMLDKFTIYELRQLLFLTHEFDHAEGFANVTRRLAYESPGHISEENPSGHWELRLDHKIVGAINSARGNLKTKIHKEVYINREFLNSACSCKKNGLFAYESALDKTRVWPLEEVLQGKSRVSIQTVLDRLKTFSYDIPDESCRWCSQDFKETVITPAIDTVQQNFDGLCLDCIDAAGKRDWGFKYRGHRYRKVWHRSNSCRIWHEQPTWYYSGPARSGERNHFTGARDSKKRSADEIE